MKKWRIALALAAAAVPAVASAQPAGQATKLHVDMQYFTLPNGLKVVLAKDRSRRR
jgi:zinc protease